LLNVKICLKIFCTNVGDCCELLLVGDKAGVIRWGIVSAGLIANDFCLALRTLSADEHQVVK